MSHRPVASRGFSREQQLNNKEKEEKGEKNKK